MNAAIPQIRANAVPGAKILVGELAPVGRAPKAMGPTEFLRKWLCLNKRFKRTSSGAGCSSFKKIAAQGFAHHPYGPTERVPKKQDVINMLAIRQLGKYLDQAARAGPDHGEAADLQHRVRPAEQPAGPAREHAASRSRRR